MQRLSLVMVGDLATHFADALLNLLRRNGGSQGLHFRTYVHRVLCASGSFTARSSFQSSCSGTSRMRIASPVSFAFSLAGQGKPRTQMISSPIAKSGQLFRPAPVMCRYGSMSFSFLIPFECAGLN